MRFVFSFCIAFLLCACQAPQISPKQDGTLSFSQSKRALQRAYQNEPFEEEFYCGVKFDPSTLALILSPHYTPRNPTTKANKPNPRTQRIEFEHIMSAHRFGKDLPCWRNGGRKACKNDGEFIKMEGDRRNLVPAIGEINADRSNFSFADAPKDIVYSQYGQCKVYADFKAKRFYPQNHSKGIIARIYLYMSETYNIMLEKEELELMRKWNKLYPPNAYEKALLRTQEALP